MSTSPAWEKEYEELAHAYFEPGDKNYWDGIEYAQSFIHNLLATQNREHQLLVLEEHALVKKMERERVVKILEVEKTAHNWLNPSDVCFVINEAIKLITQ